MAVRIQLRRATANDWTSSNPTLAEGEVGIELDTNRLKIGDGTTAWTSLEYFSEDRSPVVSMQEAVGAKNGSNLLFVSALSSYTPGQLFVIYNNIQLVPFTEINPPTGVVQLSLAPEEGDSVKIFQWT